MVTYEDENLSLINENTEGKIKSGKSRETGKIGYNRRRQTKQKHNIIKQQHNKTTTQYVLDTTKRKQPQIT
jgi:hypothetical protein